MIDCAVSNQFLVFSNDTNTIAVDINSTPCNAFEFNRPRDLSNENQSDNSSDTIDGNTPIVSSSFSVCGKLFLCCCQKYLSAWEVDSWKQIGKKTIQRSANKVIFSPSNDILVADKSGDVYLHLMKDFDSPGTLLLGHLSMLLDVLVTPDEKFIITCDRDEKIRISFYPKSYIINSYCLGHEDFVNNIYLLPHDSSLLTSSGGDGTIRIWNFMEGKELLCHSLADDIPDVNKDDISQIISDRGLVSQHKSDASLLYSSVFKVNVVIIHLIRNSGSEISCDVWQIIKTDYTPICFELIDQGKLLWFILEDKVKPLVGFELSSDAYIPSSSELLTKLQDIFQKYSNILLKNIDLREKFINSLTKKRFDNEGEYYKRKQERLDSKNVKKLAT